MKWRTAVFFALLAGMTLAYILLPRQTWSPREKRVLAQAPALTAENVLSGDFSSGAEDWFADHVPLRDALVSINAHLNNALGQNGLEDVIASGDRLFAAPAQFDPAVCDYAASKINAFARETGLPCTLMLIPEAGEALEDLLPGLHLSYHGAQTAAYMREALDPDISVLFPIDELADPAMYYRTDHHYTSAGAYTACSVYAAGIGRSLPAPDTYSVARYPGFYGTAYARSGLWETAPDTLEVWDGGIEAGLTADGKTHDGFFFEEHLSDDDKYPVFLDGNHALVRIDTGRTGGEKLLIVRDSFGHCFAPFACELFDEIVLADLRYFHTGVRALTEQEHFDRVLFLYGCDTFLTENNWFWMN